MGEKPLAPHVARAIQLAQVGSDARTVAPHVEAAIQTARGLAPSSSPTQGARAGGQPPATHLQSAVQRSTAVAAPRAPAPHVAAQMAQLAPHPAALQRARDLAQPTFSPPTLQPMKRKRRRSARLAKKEQEKDRKMGRRRSQRLLKRKGLPSSSYSYKAPKKRKKARMLWNERRPSFEETTWTTMLNTVASKNVSGVNLYKCPECHRWVPRKRDLNSLTINKIEILTGEMKDTSEIKKDFIARLNVVSLDHKTNWKQYIWSNAEPTSTGEITKAAAKEAYNDTDNLEVMCKSCNSSKGGPKGVYD